jgi:hypothetical protein
MYNLGSAAAATGLNKSSVLRAIKAGRISATKSEVGEWQIQPAELHRVYPPVAETTEPAQPEQSGATVRVAGLEAEIRGLRDVAELLRAQLTETRVDRDQWREVASRLALPNAEQKRRPWWRLHF